MVLTNIMCTAQGPGSASLADSWSSQHGLTNVLVWGDTTDYMYNNFAGAVGGGYPFTMVVDLRTMELVYHDIGDVQEARSAINTVIENTQECDP